MIQCRKKLCQLIRSDDDNAYVLRKWGFLSNSRFGFNLFKQAIYAKKGILMSSKQNLT